MSRRNPSWQVWHSREQEIKNGTPPFPTVPPFNYDITYAVFTIHTWPFLTYCHTCPHLLLTWSWYRPLIQTADLFKVWRPPHIRLLCYHLNIIHHLLTFFLMQSYVRYRIYLDFVNTSPSTGLYINQNKTVIYKDEFLLDGAAIFFPDMNQVDALEH